MTTPKLNADLYLYDESAPSILDNDGHVTVDVEAERFRMSITAWDPDPMRRLAAACEEAAQLLERQAAEKETAA